MPGPGTYDATKFSSPTKSKATVLIGCGPKLAKDFTTQQIVPGPGTYKLKREFTPVGAIIGNEPRLGEGSSMSKVVPGPGTYQLKDKLEKTGAAIPVAKRFVYEATIGPGPGAYKIPGGFGYIKA